MVYTSTEWALNNLQQLELKSKQFKFSQVTQVDVINNESSLLNKNNNSEKLHIISVHNIINKGGLAILFQHLICEFSLAVGISLIEFIQLVKRLVKVFNSQVETAEKSIESGQVLFFVHNVIGDLIEDYHHRVTIPMKHHIQRHNQKQKDSNQILLLVLMVLVVLVDHDDDDDSDIRSKHQIGNSTDTGRGGLPKPNSLHSKDSEHRIHKLSNTNIYSAASISSNNNNRFKYPNQDTPRAHSHMSTRHKRAQSLSKKNQKKSPVSNENEDTDNSHDMKERKPAKLRPSSLLVLPSRHNHQRAIT